MIQFFLDLYYTHHKDSKPIRVVDDHFKSTHSVFWRTVYATTQMFSKKNRKRKRTKGRQTGGEQTIERLKEKKKNKGRREEREKNNERKKEKKE